MTINEYQNVKDFSYEGYCGYLNKKYGAVPRKYGSSKNKRPDDGLFIHHVREDEVASLSNRKIALANDPAYQEPENLVYCNYLEHLLLHIMIGEETAGTKNLGLNGPFVFIVPALKNYFERGWKNEKINAGYYSAIEGNKEVYDILLKRYNKIVCDTDLVLEHNSTLYPQVEDCLNNKNKALVVLGTGLGKTTTALQYIWKNQCRALVIGPNKLIKSGWERYAGWCDTITYQAFANKYDKINYDRYGLVVLDEAHHAGYDETSGKGAEVWSRGINYLVENGIKLLGLTATPKRSDGIDICDTIFEGCVCEGKAVEDAIEEGIIHPFSYVTAIYNTDEIIEEYRDCENAELVGQLNLAINNTPTIKEIFNEHMPKNKRKGIIFIQEIADKPYVTDIFKDIYPDVEYRAIDSLMDPEVVSVNRKWFEETDEGYLLAINMISEGAHYKGVNTLIMFRRTNSYLVYTQQLGRIITLAKDENPEAIVFDLVNNVDNVEYNDRKIENNKRYSVSRVLDAIRRRAEKSEQIIVADETRDIVEAIRGIKDWNKPWSENEKQILIDYYSKNKSVKIDIEPLLILLPKKSRTQIINEAVFLGLSKKKNKWTEDEIKILKEFYMSEGTTIITRLPSRTKQQILQMASRLNLKYNNPKTWSEDEIQILKNNYAILGKKCIELLPNRTTAQIQGMASSLNIIYNGRGWSEEQKNIILEEYSSLGGKKLKEKYPIIFEYKNASTINTFAKSLGLKMINAQGQKPVICIELNKTFKSIKEAQEFIGIGSVCIAIKNDSTCGGYHWKYVEERG